MRQDARVKRTRRAIVDAFNRLVLERRVRDIRVADVISDAKVGRSTFYDHYASASALHMEALRRPFTPLADAAAGDGDEQALEALLQHFWDYRERARRTFDSRAEQLLAQMVEDRLGGEPLAVPARLAARKLAGAAFAPLSAWLRGEAPCTAAQLGRSLIRSAKALRMSVNAGDPPA